jgi:hypothetical protein
VTAGPSLPMCLLAKKPLPCSGASSASNPRKALVASSPSSRHGSARGRWLTSTGCAGRWNAAASWTRRCTASTRVTRSRPALRRRSCRPRAWPRRSPPGSPPHILCRLVPSRRARHGWRRRSTQTPGLAAGRILSGHRAGLRPAGCRGPGVLGQACGEPHALWQRSSRAPSAVGVRPATRLATPLHRPPRGQQWGRTSG